MNYAPPQYPGQQPYQPAPAPQQYPAQQLGYPPQPPVQYAANAQQYGAPAPAPQQLASGTLADFYDQPTVGGGASLKFENVGDRYVGVVARALGKGDVTQQTNAQGAPQTFPDGRPKWVMKVPLASVIKVVNGQAQGVSEDGLAQWWVKGGARDELVRAMAEAGCDQAVIEAGPEAGSTIDVTHNATRQSRAGYNPTKLFQVRYTRPANTEAPAPAPAATPPVAEAPQQYAAPTAPQATVNYAPPAAPAQQYAPPTTAPQAPPQYAAPAPQQAQAPQPQAAPAPQATQPNGLDPAAQAMLAKLTQAPVAQAQ